MKPASEETHSFLENFSGDWIAGNPKAVKMLWELVAGQDDQNTLNRLLKSLVIRYTEAEKVISQQNQELLKKQAGLDEDLKASARIQLALLPQKPPKLPGISISRKFLPSNQIGGDILNFFEPDQKHLLFYVLDVSGHGVPAAMVTVYLSQLLQPAAGITVTVDESSRVVTPTPPNRVLELLEKNFSYQRFKQYFTMVYGVIDTTTGQTEICNGGHPMPILMQPGQPLQLIQPGASLVGMGMNKTFTQLSLRLLPGARLVVYTDGITEARDLKKEFYGEERLHQCLSKLLPEPAPCILDAVLADLEGFTKGCRLEDDVTIMVLDYQGPN